MRHMPLPLSSSLMIRSGFEPNFLMVDLCCEVKLSLVTCGGGVGNKLLCLFKEQCYVGGVGCRPFSG